MRRGTLYGVGQGPHFVGQSTRYSGGQPRPPLGTGGLLAGLCVSPNQISIAPLNAYSPGISTVPSVGTARKHGHTQVSRPSAVKKPAVQNVRTSPLAVKRGAVASVSPVVKAKTKPPIVKPSTPTVRTSTAKSAVPSVPTATVAMPSPAIKVKAGAGTKLDGKWLFEHLLELHSRLNEDPVNNVNDLTASDYCSDGTWDVDSLCQDISIITARCKATEQPNVQTNKAMQLQAVALSSGGYGNWLFAHLAEMHSRLGAETVDVKDYSTNGVWDWKGLYEDISIITARCNADPVRSETNAKKLNTLLQVQKEQHKKQDEEIKNRQKRSLAAMSSRHQKELSTLTSQHTRQLQQLTRSALQSEQAAMSKQQQQLQAQGLLQRDPVQAQAILKRQAQLGQSHTAQLKAKMVTTHRQERDALTKKHGKLSADLKQAQLAENRKREQMQKQELDAAAKKHTAQHMVAEKVQIVPLPVRVTLLAACVLCLRSLLLVATRTIVTSDCTEPIPCGFTGTASNSSSSQGGNWFAEQRGVIEYAKSSSHSTEAFFPNCHCSTHQEATTRHPEHYSSEWGQESEAGYCCICGRQGCRNRAASHHETEATACLATESSRDNTEAVIGSHVEPTSKGALHTHEPAHEAAAAAHTICSAVGAGCHE